MTQPTLALIVFLFPLAYSPGPGNLFFAAAGARFGLGGTLSATTGYHAATLLVTLILGFGFSTLSLAAPMGGAFLRWAGAAYVLWLAWRFAREGTSRGPVACRRVGFIDGVVLLILNPKAYAIIAVMFSQFLGRGADGRAGEVVWIASVFTLNNLVAFTVWTLAGDLFGGWFRDPRKARCLNLGFAGLLAAVAVWISLG